MKQILKNSDEALYLPFCFLSELFSKLLNLFPSLSPLDTRKLLIRPGGLGDLVLLDLALTQNGISLGECFFVIETRSEPWAKYRGMDYICYDQHPFLAFRKLANRFLTVINTEQYYGLAQALGNLAKAKSGRKFGFSSNRALNYFTDVIAYDPYNDHEFKSFESIIVAAFGVRNKKSLGSQSELRNETFWIHIAGTDIPERLLSVDKWMDLVLEEIKIDQYQKIVIGFAPSDELIAESIQISLRKTQTLPTELFRGEFKDLCEELKKVKRVFTVDGGIVHVCSHFGTPVTAVFTSGRSSKWLPLSPQSAIIQKKGLECQPCTLYGQTPDCPNLLACHELNWNSDRRAL